MLIYVICLYLHISSYKTQELLTVRQYMRSLTVFGEFLLLIFLILCFNCFLVCLRPASCMPNVSCVSGLSILACPFGFL
jgi:hypothetical protein